MLPLKMARPQWFSGAALCIGSMAPDFEYFLKGKPMTGIGHTIVGQFTFCLPLTMFVVWLVRRVIIRPLALHAPDGGEFHLKDYRVLAETPLTLSDWLKVVVSALIGSFSHIIWDSFTHETGWAAQRISFIQRHLFSVGDSHIHVFKLLQHGGSIVCGLLSIFLLYQIGKRRLLLRWADKVSPSAKHQPSLSSQRILWGTVVTFALVGAVLGRVMIGQPKPWFSLYNWGHIFLKTVYFTFAGLCMGCVLCERQMKRKDG